MLNLIGKSVKFLCPTAGNGGKFVRQAVDAIVVGFDPMADLQEFPRLHLAYLHPDRNAALSGSDWRFAFDRVMSVRHVSDAVASDEGVPAYDFPTFFAPAEPEPEKEGDEAPQKPKLVKGAKAKQAAAQ